MSNPFLFSTAQRVVSDSEFVDLFSPEILNILEELEDPWGSLVYLRSAEGGGKTSLLKMLSPNVLNKAIRFQNTDNAISTYERLTKLGVICGDYPRLVCALLPFSSEYRALESLEDGEKIFNALVDVRIVLATLRAFFLINSFSDASELKQIQIKLDSKENTGIPKLIDGHEMMEWALSYEEQIVDYLNPQMKLERIDSVIEYYQFDSLEWFNNAIFFDKRGQLDAKRVLLIDDMHLLSDKQNKIMKSRFANAQLKNGIWIAEQLSATNFQESSIRRSSRSQKNSNQIQNLFSI